MRRRDTRTHMNSESWTDCGPLRFVILSRLSDDEQAKGADTSLDSQERRCTAAVERYIEAHGGSIVTKLRGEKTGTTLKRPDWREIERLAESRAFDVLVAVRMDRVARGKTWNVADYLLGEERVVVWLAEDSFTQDAAGRTMQQIYVLRDGMYPDYVSQNVKNSQVEMVRSGYWPGGVYPLGVITEKAPGMEDLHLPGGKIKRAPRVPRWHPAESRIVVEAFRLMMIHKNIGEVTSYLRLSDTTRSWSNKDARTLLEHRVYQGVIQWGPNINENVPGFPPLVDEVTWNAVQKILQERKEKAVASEGPQFARHAVSADTGEVFPYFFRGLVHCSHCGTLMTPANHKGTSGPVRYYECTRIASKGHAACPTKRVNANALHNSVVMEIARCGKYPTRLTLLIREAVRHMPGADEAKLELKRLERNRRETEKKITRLVEAIKQGLNNARLRDEMRDLEKLAGEQEKDIQIALSTVAERQGQFPNAARISALWGRFAQLWEAATNDQRQRLLCLLVDKIEIKGRSSDGKKIEGHLHMILEMPSSDVCVLSDEWVRG